MLFFNAITFKWYNTIRSLGFTASLSEYDKRKLAIFNVLNFFGVITGIIIPVAGIFNDDNLPPLAWVVAVSPLFISSLAIFLTGNKKHEAAKLVYFTCYPLFTALIYLIRIDVGIELFFIVYGILAVFLFQEKRNAALSFILSLLLYFVIHVLPVNFYSFSLTGANRGFYLFNQILGIFFIFLCTYLFKEENYSYLKSLQSINKELNQKNEEIAKQAAELQELDILKNKLFSIISHDLKLPLYALRNLFRNVQDYDIPAEDIKVLVPDIVKDLNYTTGLMENVLLWAKSQMTSSGVNAEKIDVQKLVMEVIALLRLQADAKKIYLECKVETPVYIYADKEMINLVLRNLVSNAIKFTNEKGVVKIGATAMKKQLEVFVEDTGRGIEKEILEKLNENNFFTSRGTSNEAGTGLGLMLCKDFLKKNGGEMIIKSTPGLGSRFSFILPKNNLVN